MATVTLSVLTHCPACGLEVRAHQVASHLHGDRCARRSRESRLLSAGYVISGFRAKTAQYLDFVHRLTRCGFPVDEVDGPPTNPPTRLCECGPGRPPAGDPLSTDQTCVWMPRWLGVALLVWERGESPASVGDEVYLYGGEVFGRRRFGHWMRLCARFPEVRQTIVELVTITGEPCEENGYGEVIRHTLDALYETRLAPAEKA